MDDDSDGTASTDSAVDAGTAYGYAPAVGGGGGAAPGDDDTMDILESLAALSRQLAADAAEDDAIVQALATSWAEGEQPAAGRRLQ